MAKDKSRYFIIHKPYRVLSQFTSEGNNPGLSSIYDLPKNVYPVGRLDFESEGLLILTNDKSLNNKLLNPAYNHKKIYWVELEGKPSKSEMNKFKMGLTINLKGKKHDTKPAKIQFIQPDITPRNPPVNEKKHPERSWVEIVLTEGKNRQIRKMTAAIGHPTLRLIRVGIEELRLTPLKSGEITEISKNVLYRKLRLL